MEDNLSLIIYKKLSTKEKLILYFIVYSFIGWCLETFYAFCVFGCFVKRGFLLGPVCPIYGFGAILLIINLSKIKKNNIIKFLVAMIVFSLFEFSASWMLETLFHQRWWDYSNAFLNVQGRICLSFSILWGIIGLLFINVIHPFISNHVEGKLKRKNTAIQRTIIYSIGFLMLIDMVASSIIHII